MLGDEIKTHGEQDFGSSACYPEDGVADPTSHRETKILNFNGKKQ